jgi:hypothetical protein
MADFICNIAKGRLAQYGDLPAASDALIMMLIEASGVEADGTLKDKTTFTDYLTGATNEQTTGGRKTISASVTVTVDQSNDWVDIDIPDQVYTGLTGNAISDVVIGYDNDTGAGNDANIIPVSQHDFSTTPDGSDVTVKIATAGIWRAT